jgi:ACS family hexuronate transporter-like MFS transporter
MCAMLFFATTVNYMDRQVLSLTWKEFIQPEFHWSNEQYGDITAYFSIAYAIFCLFAGKFIDWMGTKKGYLIAIIVWSLGAVMHAGCGIATTWFVDGVSDKAQLISATGDTISTIAMVSVWLFLACRLILGLGEAGNFPAAIKVTAEYFPKKDRAFATSIFNAGASVGALAAPATIPLLAKAMGWEWAFIIIGALGFLWAGIWVFVYDKPRESKHVNQAELDYIHQDDAEAPKQEVKEEKQMSFIEAFKHRQTWSFAFGKFMTDGVWWFFLFWAPAYFQDQFGIKASHSLGVVLIFTLYAIVTVVSLFGGYLPKIFVEKKGMEPYSGRMLAMLLFAFFPLLALGAQPLGGIWGPWAVAIIIGIVGAAHQSWSANIFSTVGDMFPKSAIATITGIGAMAGGVGSFLINKGSGKLFDFAAGKFTFGGQEFIANADGIKKAFDIQMIPTGRESAWYADIVSAKEGALVQAENFTFGGQSFPLSGEGIEQAFNIKTQVGTQAADLMNVIAEQGGQMIHQPMEAFGFIGTPAGYMIIFCICAVAYLIGWTVMKVLVPKHKPVVLD